MFKSVKSRAVAAAVIALSLVGASAQAANAAVTPSPSATEFYILDDNAQLIADNATRQWDDFIIGSPTADGTGAFVGSDDAPVVKVFLSARGQETNVASWIGVNNDVFYPAGSKDIAFPNLSLSGLLGDGMGAVKTNGGQYSLGLAFLKNGSTEIATAGVSFAYVTVAAGGAWSYVASKADVVVEDPCVVDPSSCQTGDIDLEAAVIGAQDGALSLTVPAGAKATFGAATLVNQLSTSTATLPEVTVSDARVVTRPGWTLTQSVANFVSGANTIEAKHLGVTPKIVAAGTTSTNAVAGAAQAAGSAVFPAGFAEAPAGPASLGDTKLSADLKLVAPADAPAGTYTSKMTLTLVSK